MIEGTIGNYLAEMLKTITQVNVVILIGLILAFAVMITRDIHEIAIILFPLYFLMAGIGVKFNVAIAAAFMFIWIFEIFADNIITKKIVEYMV